MEFELIRRLRARAARSGSRIALGIGDDAAIVANPPDHQTVVALDTLVEGVHYFADTDPADVGWKALAVNLSDLAAMGAQPAYALLSLALPSIDQHWLDAFLDGWLQLADQANVQLIGGDMTRSNTAVISVSVAGHVPTGTALRRDGGRVGDLIAITGTLGDAAAALASIEQGLPVNEALARRLHRPVPRWQTGIKLRQIASAAIDLSDGLAGDLQHLCEASHVGAQIELEQLPRSPAFDAIAATERQRQQWQLVGGDDYELCCCVPPQRAAELAALDEPMTIIGRLVAGDGVSLRHHGQVVEFNRTAYTHFA